jgi:hypothetical protein
MRRQCLRGPAQRVRAPIARLKSAIDVSLAR